jgi:hypothetical protein
VTTDRLVHYTRGGPWHGYLNQSYVADWLEELRDLLSGSNPRANAEALVLQNSSIAHVSASYRESSDG